MLAYPTAGEQPALLRIDARIPTGRAHLPPLPQQIERLRREHDLSVFATLRLLDPDDVLRGVDVLDLEADDLADAQAGPIGEAQQDADVEAACHREEAPRLLLAQD